MKAKNKCPKCGCKETIKSSSGGGYNMPIGMNEETIKCKKCGNIKYHWELGCTYIYNWKDLTTPPIKYRIIQKIKSLFSKNKDDLPF